MASEEGQECFPDYCQAKANEDVSLYASEEANERTWAHLQLSSLTAVEKSCHDVDCEWLVLLVEAGS